MMSAPSRASVMAWLRPWPRAAPVMKATLPSTRPVIVLSSLSLCVCCVQHVMLVLAGFRTKAGEPVTRSARFVVAEPGVGKPGTVSQFGAETGRMPREIRPQVDRAAGLEAPAVCEGADVHRVVAEGVQQLGDLGLGGGVIAGDGQGAAVRGAGGPGEGEQAGRE